MENIVAATVPQRQKGMTCCSRETPAAERFGTCPQCGLGTVVTKRARRGRRPFWGCDRYPDCDYSTWTKPGRPEQDGEAPAAAAAAGG